MSQHVPNVMQIRTAIRAEVARMLGRDDFTLHLPRDFIIRAPADAIGEGDWIFGDGDGDPAVLNVLDEAVASVRRQFPVARI